MLAALATGFTGLLIGNTLQFWKVKRSQSDVPPALTDVARDSDLQSNIFVASVSALAVLLPIKSWSLTHSPGITLLALLGCASLVAAAVLEGNAFGAQHSTACLIAMIAILLWASNFKVNPLLLILLVSTCTGVYVIRKNKEPQVRTGFVLGEYLLVILGVWMLMSIHKSTLEPSPRLQLRM